MSCPVWLITGCSSGFGLEIARRALTKGHRVIATSRNPKKNEDLVQEIESKGGRWIALDVTAPDLSSVVDKAKALYGTIDILVNNAGFSLNGGFEDLSENDLRAQFETNVFGVFKMMKAVLPGMRERQSGIVINIGSTGGLRSLPGVSLYASSKHALEGLTEAVWHEYRDFNVKIVLVEPGPFRTNFLGGNAAVIRPMSSFYKGTSTETTLNHLKDSHGDQPGDPIKAATIIVDYALGEGSAKGSNEFLRLPLGSGALKTVQGKIESLEENLAGVREMAQSADF
ncbi:Putative oxidoreductase yusZ [Fusarium oxysporum f. sp. cubense race 1]|uniref:Putative oxidoreductase yusZ n=1 Tax=Fusarium oxysporum f. sp. cubense (strain race 1) TaxID=1229664 RepID=N4U552_FUSC1|nr:Putative oxidoreductase yusZ [Fusarium oxysporum f. sp. cubense race 1]